MRAVELLKQRSSQTRVLIEEGDLTRLLPRLRVGEIDVFVGRLEPGYSAPDLETEPLLREPMAIVVRADHPLAAVPRPDWNDLAALPWVVPPPWASSRAKLEQMFYKHRLAPPSDIVETASFLVTLSFVRERPALGFFARGVARHFEREGLLKVLPLRIPIELPPVGIITLRGRTRTPATALLIECLRQVAAGDDGSAAPA